MLDMTFMHVRNDARERTVQPPRRRALQ
jgi:hypothetical protein